VTGVSTPVYVQGFPGHERGGVQEEDRFDHLPDLAHPPQRAQPHEESVCLGRVRRRLDHTWGHRVHTDA